MQAGIIAVTKALRHQKAESDVDLSQVLEHCVSSRLYEQIDRVTELIDSLKPRVPDLLIGECERVPI